MLPEATVAVVNGIAISEDELDKEVGKELPRAYFHSNVTDDKLKVLKEKALKSLIEKTLLYHYALSKNITVSDREVEKVIEKLEDAYGSKAQFANVIKRLGFTAETFKKAVKKDEVLKKLYKKEIEVLLSDKELEIYYKKNRYKFKEPEKIRVRLIYVRNDPTDPKGKEKAKKRVDEAYKKLKEGADFADLAAEYSNAMSRIKGGDMGYLHRGRLDAAIEEKAFAMDSDTVSEIIEADIGYFIVKVEDKIEPNQLSFETVKGGLRQELKQRQEDERKSELLKQLMSSAVIVK